MLLFGLGNIIIVVLVKYSQREILTAWTENYKYQKIYNTLFETLEEAIIARNESGIAYFNKKGGNLLDNVKSTITK